MTVSDADLASATVAADETIRERRYKFLVQRVAGGTFTEIAARHKASTGQTVSVTTVRKDVEAAKRDIISESTREGMIAEVHTVLQTVRRANFNAMAGGDVDAAKIVLATAQQQRDLFGLDAPKTSVIGIGTNVEFAAELVELIDQIGNDERKALEQVAHGDRDYVDAEIVAPANPKNASSDVREAEVVQQTISADDERERAANGATSPSPSDSGTWSNLS